jgi:hypothetical protein
MDRFKDPLKDIRASLKLASDPLKEHREMMASISDPIKGFRTSLALMSDPLEEYREMLTSFPDPMKDIRASLALISDPMKEYREMLASFSDPMKDIRASLALISDPMKEYREILASFSDPMKDIRSSLALMSDPMKELRETFALKSGSIDEILKSISNNSSLRSIRDIALEVQADLEADDEGGVTLSSKHMAVSELQELSNNIFRESTLVETSSLEESINILVGEIQSQKDPLTQKILIYFIYPLIIVIIASLINPVAEHHVKTYLNSDKKALAKELKVSVNSRVSNKEILSSFRYVSADILNVRSSASIKSETVGYLRFSSTVLIIEKKKNWTLIEWRDPDTEARITGWVFTRYLANFR